MVEQIIHIKAYNSLFYLFFELAEEKFNLRLEKNFILNFSVGSRDNASLPENAVSSRGHAGRSSGRRDYDRKTRKEQAKANHCRASGETRARVTGREIRWVLSSHPERPEECFWRSHPRCPRTARTTQEKEMRSVVRPFEEWPAKHDSYWMSFHKTKSIKTCIGQLTILI